MALPGKWLLYIMQYNIATVILRLKLALTITIFTLTVRNHTNPNYRPLLSLRIHGASLDLHGSNTNSNPYP